MFRNYFLVALRNILRHKTFSLITIAGLAMGMAVSIIIGLFLYAELTHDQCHRNLSRIYRVEIGQYPLTPYPLAELIKNKFPECDKVVRLNNTAGRQVIKYGVNYYTIENMAYTDPSFFDIFTFDMLIGDPGTILTNNHSIVLAQTTAQKIFGNKNPMGQIINFGNMDLTVTGIMHDQARNSSLQIDALLPFEFYELLEGKNNLNWGNFSHFTYLLINKGTSVQELEAKIHTAMLVRFKQEAGMTGWNEQLEEQFKLKLRPFKNAYFTQSQYDPNRHGNLRYMYVFAAVGLFVLCMAIINYINLATARAGTRTKEIYIRKILGVKKRYLVFQFIGESIIISFISLILAIAVVELVVPEIIKSTGIYIAVDYLQHPMSIAVVLLCVVIIGIMAGLYPAFCISRSGQVTSLSKNAIDGRTGLGLRKVLVVFQYIITVGLLSGLGIMYSQLKHMQGQDPGFNKDHVLYFGATDKIIKHWESFRNELIQNPSIKYVGLSKEVPGCVLMQWGRWIQGAERMIYVLPVAENFIKVMGLQIVAGRNFVPEDAQKKRNIFIINETAKVNFNLKDPLGNNLKGEEIIGVVKDFNFRSLHNKIEPLFLAYDPNRYLGSRIVSLKISSNNVRQTIQTINKTWDKYADGFPLEYNFLDETFDNMYKSEENMGVLIGYLAALSIIIMCLGQVGLVSFILAQRTKEIGVRKILGASVTQIIWSLTKNQVLLVVIANLVAWPMVYYVMNKWLQNFAYRIHLGWGPFVLAGLVVLLIALGTISVQTIRTALANPVDSLRQE